MGNYHKIQGIIDNIHEYSDSLYGVTEYTIGLLKLNVIKIKNTLNSILKVRSVSKPNVIQITSKPVKTTLKSNAKLDPNKFSIKQKLFTTLPSYLFFNDSKIKFSNHIIIFIAKIFKSEHLIKIKNSFSHLLKINVYPNENNLDIQNKPLASNLLIETDNNYQNIEISNSDVNASAWYFLKLGNISGTLSDIPDETIESLGRKKVV